MFERKRTKLLAEKYEIPNACVAGVANVDRGQVSLYMSNGKISSSMESRIENAVEKIVRIVETFGLIKLDLSNIEWVRLFIEKLAQPAYSILVSVNPTRFFVRRSEGNITTADNFINAGGFSLFVAEAIADDLFQMADEDTRDAILVLDNVFAGSPPGTIGTDPRLSEEYINAMGVEPIEAFEAVNQ